MTTYTYDNVGNLASYPVSERRHARVHLQPAESSDEPHCREHGASVTLASYAYTLGPTGNRTSVTELGGRKVDYTYDALYRLTTETITGAPAAARRPTPTIQSATVWRGPRRRLGLTMYTYDANDRLTTDTYDDNGNTIASGGSVIHLRLRESPDAVRTAVRHASSTTATAIASPKTVGGVTTRYLVDDRNLTGYAQVLEELSGAEPFNESIPTASTASARARRQAPASMGTTGTGTSGS